MKATTNRRGLLELVESVKPALARKPTYRSPGQTRILIQARKGEVTASATNGEIALVGRMKAKVTKNGGIAVEPGLLEKLLKGVVAEEVSLAAPIVKREGNCPRCYGRGEVTQYTRTECSECHSILHAEEKEICSNCQGKGKVIVSEQKTLKVGAGVTNVSMDGCDGKDFPAMPQKIKAKGGVRFVGLGQAMAKIDYAMSKDDNRETLAHLCVHQVNGKVELAAADGYRLAVTTVKTQGKMGQPMLIPRSGVAMIKKLAPDTVLIKRQGSVVELDVNGLECYIQLCEREYTAYQGLIPKTGSVVKASVNELKEAVKLAGTTDDHKVRLQWGRKGLLVTCQGYTQQIETLVPGKGRAKVALDPKYLLDLLNRFEGEITMRVQNPQSPVVAKQDGTVHVLMPKSVQW